MKTKFILLIFVVVAVLIVGFFALNSYIYNEKQVVSIATDYKNIEYTINGEKVKLTDGLAKREVAPGSASKVVTRYFGNDFLTDLNNDGREDIVFLLTQVTGGSGTMFYAVSALNTEQGYVGGDGYLLGDRVAPQNIGLSQNPRHKNVVVVNYAVREDGEPMTTQPSVGKSTYLKLDTASMQWGIVEPDFEGESR
ncbi:MAG: hypothetical protein NUW00_05295 [Candidatus Kaiserbacteria bacterium]|nr:hypothetical protein [Candidatus Kaiserbacteria bacterium]